MMPNKLHIDLKSVLERYDAILKPCPKCGKDMTPLGDPPDEPYHYCFDCKLECDMKGIEKLEAQKRNIISQRNY